MGNKALWIPRNRNFTNEANFTFLKDGVECKCINSPQWKHRDDIIQWLINHTWEGLRKIKYNKNCNLSVFPDTLNVYEDYFHVILRHLEVMTLSKDFSYLAKTWLKTKRWTRNMGISLLLIWFRMSWSLWSWRVRYPSVSGKFITFL